MRTPNCACVICGKPLYRRPSDMARVRYVACMEHRAEAQKVSGITEPQRRGLSLGRVKGTNHRSGYRHREESKIKTSLSHKKWCSTNRNLVVARGEKTRGDKHYRWNGGSSRVNCSIRRMTENRKWMDAVKARDGECVRCGSSDSLESHHVVELSELASILRVRSREDARRYAFILFNIDNGETLCQGCHYTEHGRTRR